MSDRQRRVRGTVRIGKAMRRRPALACWMVRPEPQVRTRARPGRQLGRADEQVRTAYSAPATTSLSSKLLLRGSSITLSCEEGAGTTVPLGGPFPKHERWSRRI